MSDHEKLVLFLKVLFQYLQQQNLSTQAFCANRSHLHALARALQQNNLLGEIEYTDAHLVFTVKPHLSIRVSRNIFPVLEGYAMRFKTIKEYTIYRFSLAPQNQLVIKEA